MTTLSVQKVRTRSARGLIVDGVSGHWMLSNGTDELAVARTSLFSNDMPIEAGPRQLEFRMPSTRQMSSPKGFSVVEGNATLFTGASVRGGRTRNLVNEEWTVTHASGNVLRWICGRSPARVGFFDAADTPILRLGHDPRFEIPKKVTTLRVLLNFWRAAGGSANRYLVHVDDEAITRFVPASDIAVLALIAFWMERTSESRNPNASSGSGT